MQDVPKSMKRLVRHWAAAAHDRDLSNALVDLRAQFDRWQRREITAYDLNRLIHEFHQGPSREIWKRYATNHLAPAVASAVAAGVLTREELPVPLLEHLAGLIEFFEADQSAS
jgi:hypothetical protein